MNQLRPFKFIVACKSCKNQYYANSNKIGEQFSCACGELISIPEPKPHEADVVNCAACGGARLGNRPACSFCGADFTLHEQDLHTICPNCMTRISNRAKYCHSCALPITASQLAPGETEFLCPTCQDGTQLHSRSLGKDRINIMECQTCAGVWLETTAFEKLEQRAKAGAASGITRSYKNRDKPRSVYQPLNDKFYRPCPVCKSIMHRQHYGPGSRVVIDLCAKHGLWFDNFELPDILRWVRAGGLSAAQKEQSIKLRDQARRKRVSTIRPSPSYSSASELTEIPILAFMGGLFQAFISLILRILRPFIPR